MKTRLGLAAITLASMIGAACAADVAMRRVLSCVGPDAKMEVYVPENLVTGTGAENAKLEKPAIGAYSLDLTEAGKGKVLEPVRISYSRDKKSVIIDQYTRKLPPTAVGIGGATVDFDQRFATGAKCAPFNQE